MTHLSLRSFLCAVSLATLAACSGDTLNNPYPARDSHANVVYKPFSERPKHLDPAQSFSAAESEFTAQIYEPVLQYHYLKRPYELIPLAATAVPKPAYLDKDDKPLPDNADAARIAFSVYDIRIQPGIKYQPHPAFAQDEQGRYRYHALTSEDLQKTKELRDFKFTGTRELVADDYVYEIKRLAHPKLHSPIFGVMAEYIVGLPEYSELLKKEYAKIAQGKEDGVYLDLTQFPLAGVQVLDTYTYRIKIKGKYPQLLYWLAMPFFAPIPHEADRFYAQAGMKQRNITLDWYPVGTGPYMLTVNNPNREMVLERNPNFHGETYPIEGEPEDASKGFLADAGKPLPFVDRVVFKLEKESIPYWNKFLQGYFDTSGISSTSFDQAIQFTSAGEATVTDAMKAKNIRLETAVSASIYYMGFNMLDPVVGGSSERARKLRQALSIALDYEEYISIFRNGRGTAAQGPVPPGIFGYIEGARSVNPVVYDWVNNEARRKPLAAAQKLLAEAGYKDGIDPETGSALTLNLDSTSDSAADTKARLDWMRKQFKKLNIQLVVRTTDYNRFQDKILKGSAQLYELGWGADYPDPENFLFLLYGPNGRVKFQGENSSNYTNPQFDALFKKMKNMDNSPERQVVIDEMLNIVRVDAPWIWGFHSKDFGLFHEWYKNAKPNDMANNTLKYKRVDPELRAQKRVEWNAPVTWPVWLMVAILLLGTAPAFVIYRRHEKRAAR
ncbi:MAG: ABC transporter substrate-binding protein [Gammaproteobacteria bacterium]|nr:ABC transporter substrate-binding protein [Gammaproteobacteria bacterium]